MTKELRALARKTGANQCFGYRNNPEYLEEVSPDVILALLDQLDSHKRAMREALEAIRLEMTQGPLIKECHDAIATLEKELGE